MCPSEADLNYVKSERPLIPEEGRQAPAAGHRLCSPVGYHLDITIVLLLAVSVRAYTDQSFGFNGNVC